MSKRAVPLVVALVAVGLGAARFGARQTEAPRVLSTALGTLEGEVKRAENALREGSVPLAISTDGARLLLQTQTEKGYTLSVTDRSHVVLREVETGARPRLTTWAPTGDYVTYAGDRGGAEYVVHLWNVNDGRERAVDAPSTRIVTQPKWSADGSRFTHVVEKEGQRDLYWVAKDPGSTAALVTRDLTAKAGMAWAPSGTRIATVRKSSPHAVSVVDLKHGETKTLPLGEEREIRDLAWSSDEKSILFTSRSGSETFFALSEVDLSTHNVRHFPTTTEGDVVQPFYLPEDRGVVYRVYPGDEKLVFSCERSGANCRARGPSTGQVTAWTASTSGDKLFLGQLLPRTVYEVDLATGSELVVYETPLQTDLVGRNARVDIRSKDGLLIPIHLRPGAKISAGKPAAFIQILGSFGKESPAPWDSKADYLYQAGVTVLKVYVRGKAGFGRTLLEAPGGTNGQIDDVLAAIRYAVEELRIPPSRIVLFGHSDGALLAARVAATGVEIGKLVVSGMLETKATKPPTQRVRCVDAFQGTEDRLPPEKAAAELTALFGQGAVSAPCGSMTPLPSEAHEIERAESWAKILGFIVHFVRSEPG